MYILSKTNYQDFENSVECFKTLKDAQDAMKSYYAEDKKSVGVLGGDGDETANGVTLLINVIAHWYVARSSGRSTKFMIFQTLLTAPIQQNKIFHSKMAFP